MASTPSSKSVAVETNDPIVYDGSWERAGRSLNAAAVVGLLGIGFLYFQAESILALVVVFVSSLADHLTVASDNPFEAIRTIVQSHKHEIWLVIAFSQYVFMLLPTLWLVKRWHTSHIVQYIRLQKCSLPEIVLAVLSVAAFLPTSLFLINGIVRLLHIPENLIEANQEVFTARSPSELALLIAAAAFTPAICEEVFFRGFVQRTFERSFGAKSVVIMGIIFGLFHMQPLGLLTLSALGITLGFFYYSSKSLLPSMAAHCTNNALVIVLNSPPLRASSFSAAVERISLPWVAVTLGFAACTMVLFRLAARSRRVSQEVSIITN